MHQRSTSATLTIKGQSIRPNPLPAVWRTQSVRGVLAAPEQLHELLLLQLEQQPGVLRKIPTAGTSTLPAASVLLSAMLRLSPCRRCAAMRTVHLWHSDLQHSGVHCIGRHEALRHIASPHRVPHRLALPAPHTGGVILPRALCRTRTSQTHWQPDN